MVATPEKKSAKSTKKSDDFISINLCDGNKGGVGKSFLCRALYHWFSNQFEHVCGLEADLNSPDFVGIYADHIECIKFSENEAEQDAPNLIFEVALEERRHTIINLPATAHAPFSQWLNAYGGLTLAKQHQGKFVKWFVTTGEYDSIMSLIVSLKTFGHDIPHVVVKNQKYSDWDYFEGHAELQELIKGNHCPVIELPKLPVRIASFILQKRLTLEAAASYRGDRAEGEVYTMAERAAVQQFLTRSGEQFERARSALQ